MAPVSRACAVFSQWSRRSRAPSGSTRMSAMFCTSRTSFSPRRTSSSGLKRVERGIGGIEQQAGGEAAAPAGGELPVLALDVVDDGGAGPGQQRRHHQADALAGARRRHGEDVLGAVVAQIGVIEQSEHDAARRQQAGVAHVARSPPSGPSRTWSWLCRLGSARRLPRWRSVRVRCHRRALAGRRGGTPRAPVRRRRSTRRTASTAHRRQRRRD